MEYCSANFTSISIVLETLHVVTTDMHHLMTGIRSVKCVLGDFVIV